MNRFEYAGKVTSPTQADHIASTPALFFPRLMSAGHVTRTTSLYRPRLHHLCGAMPVALRKIVIVLAALFTFVTPVSALEPAVASMGYRVADTTAPTHRDRLTYSVVSNHYVERKANRLTLAGLNLPNYAVREKLVHAASVSNDALVPVEHGFVFEPIMPADESSLYSRKGSSAAGKLLKAGLKSWWKSRSDTSLHRLSAKVTNRAPKAIKKHVTETSSTAVNSPEPYEWDYSVKLSGSKIRLKFSREF